MYVPEEALAPFDLLFKQRKRITYLPNLNSHMLKGMKPGPRPPIHFHLELLLLQSQWFRTRQHSPQPYMRDKLYAQCFICMAPYISR